MSICGRSRMRGWKNEAAVSAGAVRKTARLASHFHWSLEALLISSTLTAGASWPRSRHSDLGNMMMVAGDTGGARAFAPDDDCWPGSRRCRHLAGGPRQRSASAGGPNCWPRRHGWPTPSGVGTTAANPVRRGGAFAFGRLEITDGARLWVAGRRGAALRWWRRAPRDASSSRGASGAVATPPEARSPHRKWRPTHQVCGAPASCGGRGAWGPDRGLRPARPRAASAGLGRASPAALEWMLDGALPSPKPASSAGLPNELVRSKERAARAELMRAAVPVRRGVVHEGNEPLAPPARGSTSESSGLAGACRRAAVLGSWCESRGETSAPSGTSPVPTGHRSEIAPADSEPETVVMQTGTSPALEVEPPRLDVSDGKVARAPDLPVATTASPSRPESPDEPSATSVAVPSSGSGGRQ